jgi:hypothetical protein
MLTFLELTHDTCRYPVGEAPLPDERSAAALLFCGAPVSDRGAGPCPYCAGHWALSHAARMMPAKIARNVVEFAFATR